MHALEWTLVTILDEVRADRLPSERLHQEQMARFDQCGAVAAIAGLAGVLK